MDCDGHGSHVSGTVGGSGVKDDGMTFPMMSLGATGVQEAIYCLLMMKHDFVAPSINIETLDEGRIRGPLDRIRQWSFEGGLAAWKAKSGAIVMVGFNRRFAPHVVKMKELVAASGGPKATVYPWGPDYETGLANVDESRVTGGVYLERTTAVGIYPNGKAARGAMDMSGNVWEWTLSEYGNGEHNVMSNDRPRVLRGGSWNHSPVNARASFRLDVLPYDRYRYDGFRVVLAAPVP